MNQMNIAAVDLNLLKVFEALHEESSASRAALRLGVTQSAVSAALRRLREVYGDQLFVRTGRGLAPTLPRRQNSWTICLFFSVQNPTKTENVDSSSP
jgi:hypothetical protein